MGLRDYGGHALASQNDLLRRPLTSQFGSVILPNVNKRPFEQISVLVQLVSE